MALTFVPQYGTAKIEVGAAVLNNTDPTPLTQIPFTKMETAVFSNDANTKTPIPVEEQTAPIVILNSAQAPSVLKWSTYTNDKQLLAQLEGGTYTAPTGGKGATYSRPLTPVSVNLFVKITNLQGGGVKIYNAQIDVTRTGLFSKTGLPELAITCTALAVGDGFVPEQEFDPPTA